MPDLVKLLSWPSVAIPLLWLGARLSKTCMNFVSLLLFWRNTSPNRTCYCSTQGSTRRRSRLSSGRGGGRSSDGGVAAAAQPQTASESVPAAMPGPAVLPPADDISVREAGGAQLDLCELPEVAAVEASPAPVPSATAQATPESTAAAMTGQIPVQQAPAVASAFAAAAQVVPQPALSPPVVVPPAVLLQSQQDLAQAGPPSAASAAPPVVQPASAQQEAADTSSSRPATPPAIAPSKPVPVERVLPPPAALAPAKPVPEVGGFQRVRGSKSRKAAAAAHAAASATAAAAGPSQRRAVVSSTAGGIAVASTLQPVSAASELAVPAADPTSPVNVSRLLEQLQMQDAGGDSDSDGSFTSAASRHE